jgi:hypothetical protein
MAGNRTEFVLKARSEGFQDVSRTGRKSISELAAEGKKLERTYVGIISKQVELVKSLKKVKEGTDAYRALERQLNSVQKAGAKVQQTIAGINRATAENKMKQGRFTQGLLQGLVPEAAYLERGPGMFRQALGAELGKRMRGVASGGVHTFTSGMGGIIEALQSVPGGGLAAAPLQMQMGFAQQYLAFRGQEMQAVPYLRSRMGGISGQEWERRQYGAAWDPQRMAARRAEAARMARAEVGQVPESEFLPGGKHAPGPWMSSELGELERGTAKRTRVGPYGAWEEAAPPEAFQDLKARRRMAVMVGRDQLTAERERQIGEELMQRDLRRVRRPETLMDTIRRQGLSVGMAAPEALQAAAAITQAGGGRGAELRSQGMLPAAFGAMRAYGVGYGTAGQFLAAGRRGGLTGAAGASGQALVSTVGDALRMGLEGSEITAYVDQIAQGIAQWRQTGIPVNRESIAGMSRAIALTGVGAIRGGAMAQGLAGKAQELARRGPQTPEEVLLLQELGWKPGTGALGYEKAQMAIESGEALKPDLVQRLLGRVMGPGAGEGGTPEEQAKARQRGRSLLGMLDVEVGPIEMAAMAAQLGVGEMPPELAARLQQTQREMRRGGKEARDVATPEEMLRQAEQMTPAEVRRAKALENKEIGQGGKYIDAMFNLEETTRKVADAFNVLAAAPFQQLTQAISDLATMAPEFALVVKKVIDKVKDEPGQGAIEKKVHEYRSPPISFSLWGAE